MNPIDTVMAPLDSSESLDLLSRNELLKGAKKVENIVEFWNLKLDKEIVEYLCRIKLSLMNYFYQYNRLDLNLKYYSNLKLIDRLPEFSQFRIKKYDLVSLSGFKKARDPNALRLLQKLHSHNFKIFYFGNEYNPLVSKPFGYYKKELLKLLPKVTMEVCISGCTISRNEFQLIVNNSSQCKSIRFKHCKIDTAGVKFHKSIKFRANLIEFDDCTAFEADIHGRNNLEMNSVLQAISESPLKKSLIKLSVNNCGVAREDLLKDAQEFELLDIKIVDDENDY